MKAVYAFVLGFHLNLDQFCDRNCLPTIAKMCLFLLQIIREIEIVTVNIKQSEMENRRLREEGMGLSMVIS